MFIIAHRLHNQLFFATATPDGLSNAIVCSINLKCKFYTKNINNRSNVL